MRRPSNQSLFQLGLGAATASLFLGLVSIQALHQTELRNSLMELADNHMRSLLGGHLVDVSSADPHLVRPWFDDKIRFSVPAPDLTAAGYTLMGGRMDFLGGHAAPAIVYRLGKHDISVFVWPEPSGNNRAPELQPSQLGYNIVAWQTGPLTARAVSDLTGHDLRDFAVAFQSEAQH